MKWLGSGLEWRPTERMMAWRWRCVRTVATRVMGLGLMVLALLMMVFGHPYVMCAGVIVGCAAMEALTEG